MKMENEDGTRGPHWSIDETTALASQYGITLGSKFNRYDWFVALNMVYSDYYKVINAITSGNASLASQLASCCCDLRQEVCSVNNNVYYNKNNGIFQIVNHIVTPAAPAA